MDVTHEASIIFTFELDFIEAEAMESFIETALDRARQASDPHALNTTAEQWLSKYREQQQIARYG